MSIRSLYRAVLATRLRPHVVLPFLAVLAAAAWARAQQAPADAPAEESTPAKSSFVRIARNEDEQPLAMETAIARYVPANGGPDGLEVDLVAAIHIADQAYYDQLNERFEDYDAVLYELVAPEGTRVPQGGGGPRLDPVHLLQTGMKRMLKLSYQLEEIDYTCENFVHADMSPEQFAESMRERNESPLTMFFRMLGQSMARQTEGGPQGPTDAEVLQALLKPNNSLPLKRILAEQFENMEVMLSALNGPDGSTIITERNAVALEKLREQITAGRRKLAIFYGGGHMPDMHQRLLEDFGLRHERTDWLVAWDLTGAAANGGDKSPGAGKGEPSAPLPPLKRQPGSESSQGRREF